MKIIEPSSLPVAGINRAWKFWHNFVNISNEP